MARIVLIGPGAIGGAMAAALCGGHDLTICAIRGFETLTIHPAQGAAEHYKVRVVTTPEAITPADWILLCVKSHQTPGAAKWLAAAAGPHTKVAVLQNGVEHRARVAPFLDVAIPVLPVVVQLPARAIAPGEIELFGITMLEMQNDRRVWNSQACSRARGSKRARRRIFARACGKNYASTHQMARWRR